MIDIDLQVISTIITLIASLSAVLGSLFLIVNTYQNRDIGGVWVLFHAMGWILFIAIVVLLMEGAGIIVFV